MTWLTVNMRQAGKLLVKMPIARLVCTVKLDQPFAHSRQNKLQRGESALLDFAAANLVIMMQEHSMLCDSQQNSKHSYSDPAITFYHVHMQQPAAYMQPQLQRILQHGTTSTSYTWHVQPCGF
jgi:hypothetical protein